MFEFLAEFWTYLQLGNNLQWLLVGCGYFVAALVAALSRLEYPRWFVMLYLGVAGAISLKITQPIFLSDTPPYADMILIIMAVLLGATLFAVITHYAKYREEYDNLRASFKEAAENDNDSNDSKQP